MRAYLAVLTVITRNVGTKSKKIVVLDSGSAARYQVINRIGNHCGGIEHDVQASMHCSGQSDD